MRHLVVGTAGHIDHGKSALVHRLTGIDPDRLKDEKARGITIELGFADLRLDDDHVVSFVDVPGHERFVRHMVAGATGIDAVLLVVAADAGVQPQTREHLEICRLLRVRHGLVALTKIDLVDADLREVVELEVHEALAGTFLDGAPVLSVSAKDGRGLDDLRGALRRLADTVPTRSRKGAMRLPIDRSFVLRGFGTVVTGTLVSGTVEDGDEIEILPGGGRSRVRGVQVHRARVDRATAGCRTAVNLQGVSTDDVPRGATLVAPGSARTTRRLWARLDWLPHVPETTRRGAPVRFHHGTADCGARVRPLPGPDGPGAEIFLERGLPVVPGDRFILRQTAPLDTVGGGVVLDAFPPRGRAARAEIALLLAGDPATALQVRVRRGGATGVTAADLAVELGLPLEEVRAGLAARASGGAVVELAGRWHDGSGLAEAGAVLDEVLGRFHRDEPLRSGMQREPLRAAVAPDMPVEAWRAWLDRLAADGRLRVEGDRVASASHEVLLSSMDRERLARIETRFREAGLEPPDVAALVEEIGGGAERFVEMLVESGTLVRIRDGRPFHASALATLRERLREYAATSRTIDVATFKELFGVTRKNAIPLLEQLDGERCTRRVGNAREILMQ